MYDITTKNVGFIGGGNMAYAVAMGILKGGMINPANVHVSNRSMGKLAKFSAEGMQVTQDNTTVWSKCEVVILAVKPNVFPVIINELRERCDNIDISSKIITSVMGAIKVEQLQKETQNDKVIRLMPNTPCLVGAGTIMCCKATALSDEVYDGIKKMLHSCGKCFECPEELFGVASGVMGCSPAYFYVAIEALADGGVMHGLPRETALKLAARAVMGAGKLAMESDKHPEQLKDAVASPGGTTIRGLYALEKGGFRGTLIDAVNATVTPKKA